MEIKCIEKLTVLAGFAGHGFYKIEKMFHYTFLDPFLYKITNSEKTCEFPHNAKKII